MSGFGFVGSWPLIQISEINPQTDSKIVENFYSNQSNATYEKNVFSRLKQAHSGIQGFQSFSGSVFRVFRRKGHLVAQEYSMGIPQFGRFGLCKLLPITHVLSHDTFDFNHRHIYSCIGIR